MFEALLFGVANMRLLIFDLERLENPRERLENLERLIILLISSSHI